MTTTKTNPSMKTDSIQLNPNHHCSFQYAQAREAIHEDKATIIGMYHNVAKGINWEKRSKTLVIKHLGGVVKKVHPKSNDMVVTFPDGTKARY